MAVHRWTTLRQTLVRVVRMRERWVRRGQYRQRRAHGAKDAKIPR
jgi:hypothetical protein